MKRHLIYSVSAALIGFYSDDISLADDKLAAGQPDPAKMAEMMKNLEAAAAPGEHHKALQPLVGEWKAEMKAYMSPDGPPLVSHGTSKAEWVLDGRFVAEEFKGTMMGKSFHGVGLTGFDNLKQKYVSAWADNMGTAIMTSEGTAESGAKAITFNSKMDCPMTGEKDMPVKLVLRILSPDTHAFEMHDPRKGEKSKTMEITYTRK